MYVYSFRAPGHGKGCFDGIGGALKNKIHSLIKGAKTGGDNIAGTASGYLSSIEDVHDALKEYFENGRSVSRKNKAKNKVDIFKLFKHITCDSEIRRPEETFVGLEKINSCYQFVVTNVGVMSLRMQSCWCLKCTAAMLEGSLNWGIDNCVYGCVSSAFQTTSVYNFHRRSCAKLTGPGVGLQLAQRLARNEMVSGITPGSWLLSKGSGKDRPGYLAQRAISKAEWRNDCKRKNISCSTKMIEGVEVTRNGYAINVQWYTQKSLGVPEYVLRANPPCV
jgi:hypothetical protein